MDRREYIGGPKSIRWSGVIDSNFAPAGGSFYFPFAEKFLQHCPWLAVRVFRLIIRLREKITSNG